MKMEIGQRFQDRRPILFLSFSLLRITGECDRKTIFTLLLKNQASCNFFLTDYGNYFYEHK